MARSIITYTRSTCAHRTQTRIRPLPDYTRNRDRTRARTTQSRASRAYAAPKDKKIMPSVGLANFLHTHSEDGPQLEKWQKHVHGRWAFCLAGNGMGATGESLNGQASRIYGSSIGCAPLLTQLARPCDLRATPKNAAARRSIRFVPAPCSLPVLNV